MVIDKKTMKKLGIRLPSNVELNCEEKKGEYHFSFVVRKTGQRSSKGRNEH